MRVRLMAAIAIAASATFVGSIASRTEDKVAPRVHAIGTKEAVAPISQLAEQMPDGAELIDIYKAARTVADIEAANAKAKGEVGEAQSIASNFARLHAARISACKEVDASRLDATSAKAQAFSATLARIDGELSGSLATMRRTVANGRRVSTRTMDEADRYTVAVHDFGRLKLQAQELAKAIHGVARNIRSMEASCRPTPIPPLFAGGDSPSRKASLRRPPPIPRKGPAKAAAKAARFSSGF